jgi:hypothetical protein
LRRRRWRANDGFIEAATYRHGNEVSRQQYNRQSLWACQSPLTNEALMFRFTIRDALWSAVLLGMGAA